MGRLSDPCFLDGRLPVAPSAIAPKGHVSLLRPKRDYVTRRALDAAEIPGIVAAFRKGAENAKRAGFDGVELHWANGYLLDAFLQNIANQRIDQYGGSIKNRARLLLEATDAVISVWGAVARPMPPPRPVMMTFTLVPVPSTRRIAHSTAPALRADAARWGLICVCPNSEEPGRTRRSRRARHPCRALARR